MAPFRIDDRLGHYDAVRALDPDKAPILDAVRQAIAELHPDAVETASLKERSVTWGFAAGKMTAAYAYAMLHKAHVNLGFFQGIHLPDPDGLLEGTGKVLRHVKLREPGAVAAPAIRALIVAARDERQKALGL